MNSVQIRMARAALEWDVAMLAAKAGLTQEAVLGLERGLTSDPSVRDAVRYTLEQAGLSFIGEDESGGSGIRLRRTGPPDEGLRPEQLNAENDG
jgi:DNA-binding XRE family transcriptional regulator